MKYELGEEELIPLLRDLGWKPDQELAIKDTRASRVYQRWSLSNGVGSSSYVTLTWVRRSPNPKKQEWHEFELLDSKLAFIAEAHHVSIKRLMALAYRRYLVAAEMSEGLAEIGGYRDAAKAADVPDQETWTDRGRNIVVRAVGTGMFTARFGTTQDEQLPHQAMNGSHTPGQALAELGRIWDENLAASAFHAKLGG
jgi:hypothetical protein